MEHVKRELRVVLSPFSGLLNQVMLIRREQKNTIVRLIHVNQFCFGSWMVSVDNVVSSKPLEEYRTSESNEKANLNVIFIVTRNGMIMLSAVRISRVIHPNERSQDKLYSL